MLDFGYFIRTLSLLWRYKGTTKRGNLFADYIVKGRCWPNDLDANGHMNNARYLRECDFSRSKFFIETGLWDALSQRRKTKTKDCNIFISALQVQYRQSVALGDKFEIITRLHGWDDNAVYMEQFMILDKNKKVAFSALCRSAVTPRHLTPQMLVDDCTIPGSIQSPPLSPSMENFKQNYKLNFQQTKTKS